VDILDRVGLIPGRDFLFKKPLFNKAEEEAPLIHSFPWLHSKEKIAACKIKASDRNDVIFQKLP
jgi:hypothetical protein